MSKKTVPIRDEWTWGLFWDMFGLPSTTSLFTKFVELFVKWYPPETHVEVLILCDSDPVSQARPDGTNAPRRTEDPTYNDMSITDALLSSLRPPNEKEKHR
jgi:hypothetical protein